MKKKHPIKIIILRIIFISILIAIVIFQSIKAYKKYIYYRPLHVMHKFMDASINNDPDAIAACCHPYFYSRIEGPALSDAAMFEEYRKNGAKINYMISDVNTGVLDDFEKNCLLKRWEIRDYRIADEGNDLNFDINSWTNSCFISVYVNIETPGNPKSNYDFLMKYFLVEIDNNWYVLNTYQNEESNYESYLDAFISFNLLEH